MVDFSDPQLRAWVRVTNPGLVPGLVSSPFRIWGIHCSSHILGFVFHLVTVMRVIIRPEGNRIDSGGFLKLDSRMIQKWSLTLGHSHTAKILGLLRGEPLRRCCKDKILRCKCNSMKSCKYRILTQS